MSTVLQNVIFPTSMDPDLLPLYVDADNWTIVDSKPVRLTDNARLSSVLGRDSYQVPAGERVSFASYFNAFPAAYWQRWTIVQHVVLDLKLSGHGTVIIYRSNSRGQIQQVTSKHITADAEHMRFELPLNSFGDGGWYWFDLVADTSDIVLKKAQWETNAKPVTTGLLSLGMCTFNKSDYCIKTLQNIADSPGLTAVIDKILLVDQGTKKVQDESQFSSVAADLGDKLRVINQGNLGGSGGYSRAMAETLKLEATDFLLLLDDDIDFEPESALRALQFGRFSKDPVLVGGHMFDLFDKPILHAWAEGIRPEPFMWGPTFKEQHRHDFRQANLRHTPWMHARLDATYNGWWMCMIPKRVIADIGLSLPVFIKWDDAEYGLRAAAAGYRTVSMPGVALWHMSWLDKDDSQDWQAYFHTRNRIIAGLLHSAYPKSGKLLQNCGRQDIKKLLNMQYYAVQLSVNAMRDILAGPEALKETIATVMPAARTLAQEFTETRVWKPSDADIPHSNASRALPTAKMYGDLHPEAAWRDTAPTGAKLAWFTLKNCANHYLRSDAKGKTAELEYAKHDAHWWTIPQHSSVIVGAADGSGKMLYHHSKADFRRLMRESNSLKREIARNWESLSRRYRAALNDLVSPESWWQIFESNS